MEKDITRLIKGYQQFRATHFGEEDSSFMRLVRLGQRPKVLMVACSDSRMDPALLMNCEPGELFMVRNVANLVPPYEHDLSYHGTSAALEFGVCVLEVHHVILFGHTQCGGIQSLLDHKPQDYLPDGFLTKWMELAKGAQEKIADVPDSVSFEEKVTLCGHYSLIQSLENLKTFPWIAERIRAGTLAIHAWNFDMGKGLLEAYDEKEGRFKLMPVA